MGGCIPEQVRMCRTLHRPLEVSDFGVKRRLNLCRFLNDQEIADGGNFILGEKDSVYRLDIGSVDSDLVGKIKVTAENENGKDEKEVNGG